MKHLESACQIDVTLVQGGQGIRLGDVVIRTNPHVDEDGRLGKIFILVGDNRQVSWGERAQFAPRQDGREVNSVKVIGVHHNEIKPEYGVKVGEAMTVEVTDFGEELLKLHVQTVDHLDPATDMETYGPYEDHQRRLTEFLDQQGILRRA